MSGEQTFARRAHLGVRLDAVNGVAIFEQPLAENPRARTDVRDDGIRRQTRNRARNIEHSGG